MKAACSIPIAWTKANKIGMKTNKHFKSYTFLIVMFNKKMKVRVYSNYGKRRLVLPRSSNILSCRIVHGHDGRLSRLRYTFPGPLITQ